MDKKVDRKENNYKKEKDLYTETIIKMMKNLGKRHLKKIVMNRVTIHEQQIVEMPKIIQC